LVKTIQKSLHHLKNTYAEKYEYGANLCWSQQIPIHLSKFQRKINHQLERTTSAAPEVKWQH
jgi:hypothetical protein